MASTSDAYWHSLLKYIETADSCSGGDEAGSGQGSAARSGWGFEPAFTPEVLERHAGGMPAFILAGGLGGTRRAALPQLAAADIGGLRAWRGFGKILIANAPINWLKLIGTA